MCHISISLLFRCIASMKSLSKLNSSLNILIIRDIGKPSLSITNIHYKDINYPIWYPDKNCWYWFVSYHITLHVNKNYYNWNSNLKVIYLLNFNFNFNFYFKILFYFLSMVAERYKRSIKYLSSYLTSSEYRFIYLTLQPAAAPAFL